MRWVGPACSNYLSVGWVGPARCNCLSVGKVGPVGSSCQGVCWDKVGVAYLLCVG